MTSHSAAVAVNFAAFARPSVSVAQQARMPPDSDGSDF